MQAIQTFIQGLAKGHLTELSVTVRWKRSHKPFA
jgi:hypothetical protein